MNGNPHRKLTVLLALLFAATAGCTTAADADQVSQAEMVSWIEHGTAPLVLDVRTPKEYATSHVPGAVNIPHDQLPARVSELSASQGQDVVVYCESGRRAGMAAETLEAAGFTAIRHLTGDMSAWRAAGLPVKEGERP